jgi:hypothetical protein
VAKIRGHKKTVFDTFSVNDVLSCSGLVHGRLSMPHLRDGPAHVRHRRVDVVEAGIVAREGPAHVRDRRVVRERKESLH